MALQLGYTPELSWTVLDLSDVDQTAEIIARFQPDCIFCTATLHTSSNIARLPDALAEQLARAPAGPRLPLHLTLVYSLMQAVKRSGLSPLVLNAAYPDTVGPVLKTVGLAPASGIGDLANCFQYSERCQLHLSKLSEKSATLPANS